MFYAKRSIASMFSMTALVLVGCRSDHANFAPSRLSAARVFSSSGKSPGSTVAPLQAFPPAKHPPRDSTFSIYNNPDCGVAFRFPRIYALEEVVEEGGSMVETQQGLAAGQPGAILLATVEIPDDAHPNTNFAGGHLQFAINPEISQETCYSLVAPPGEGGNGSAPTLQGVMFYWREHSSATGDTTYHNRDYAGFSNGACYEFFLQVASTSAADNDAPVAQLDVGKIFRSLEKIVFSIQIRRPLPNNR
jgi:hypothetical protein